MRVKEFDPKQNLSHVPPEELWERLLDECSEYHDICEPTGKTLFRGIQNTSYDAFKSYPSANRIPIFGMSKEQQLANRYMKTAGLEALQSNSIFCNSSERKVQMWGEVYMIFPINGFSFAYSKKQTDTGTHNYRFPKGEGTLQELSREFIVLNGITDTDLGYAMSKRIDVWIRGHYYAVKVNSLYRQEMLK